MSKRVKCFWSLAFSSRAIAVVWSMNSSGLVIALTADPLGSRFVSAGQRASREGRPFNASGAEKSSEAESGPRASEGLKARGGWLLRLCEGAQGPPAGGPLP